MNNIDKLISEIHKAEDKLFALNQTIIKEKSAIEVELNKAKEDLNQEIIKNVSDQFTHKEYGCGTANIETEGYKCKVSVAKKVKWNEDRLREIARKITVAGQNPESYIKYKLSVSESDYSSFENPIKNAFKAARTVEAGEAKVSYEMK